MKIVQISSGIVKIPPSKGGAVEEHILKLSTELSRYCSVSIVDRFYENEKNVYRIDGIKIKRIKARMMSAHPRINHILNEIIFARKLRDNLEIFMDADVIHAHNLYTGYYALKIAKKVGAKFIYTCHNGMWCADRVNFYEKAIVRKLESKIMRESDISIAVSENLRRNIIQKGNVPENKIVTIYNGVDTDFFNPDVDCKDIIQKYDLEEYFTIVFVGRIAPAKGLEYLIKALQELKDKPIKALIVGPFKYMFQEGNGRSSYGEMLVNMVKKYNLQDRVFFTDAVPRSELPKYYVAGDVFVLPSIYEAMPMVLVEAMACGKPLIGSRVGGIPEIIREGVNGLLFEPKNYKELAKKISMLMEDENLRKEVGKKSRKIVEEMFSWKKVAEKVFRIYI